MSPQEHVQEALYFRSDALKDSRQALYTWLGVAGCTALGSEMVKNVLLNGEIAETTSEIVENAGQIVAGAILAAGLVSASLKGSKAVYHGIKARWAEKQEAECAKLHNFTPHGRDHAYPPNGADHI